MSTTSDPGQGPDGEKRKEKKEKDAGGKSPKFDIDIIKTLKSTLKKTLNVNLETID